MKRRCNIVGLCIKAEDYLVDTTGKPVQIKELVDDWKSWR